MASPARPTARTYAAALGATAVLGAAALPAGSPAQASGRPIQETDVTSQPAYTHGPPAVAVNPKNPENLVFTSTVFQPSPGLLPAGGCFLAYSGNGGKTWTQVAWPLGDRPLCGESNLAVDSHGTFYILNNQVSGDLATDLTNHVVVSRSTDGGRTWTGPVTTPVTEPAGQYGPPFGSHGTVRGAQEMPGSSSGRPSAVTLLNLPVAVLGLPRARHDCLVEGDGDSGAGRCRAESCARAAC